MHTPSIRCPRCQWQPDGLPYWRCHCGHAWDAFTTTGRCPACHRIEHSTQCPPHGGGCGHTSPHEHWYPDLDRLIDAYLEEDEPPLWGRYGDVR